MKKLPKYAAEMMLQFQSTDRFLFRISDLYDLKAHIRDEYLARLDHCHIYLLGKRVKLSILPESVVANEEIVSFTVEYRYQGTPRKAFASLPRNLFHPDEVTFEASARPHCELISRDRNGQVVLSTVLPNFVDFLPNVEQIAKDIEIVYVGKGLRKSANDRLENHSKLQKLLAQMDTTDHDSEVVALVYAFEKTKPAMAMYGVPVEISGLAAKEHLLKCAAYKPSLEEQIALIEASLIAYFGTSTYNVHYLDFPDRSYAILKQVYDADFGAIFVQIDNTNIGGQRIYSKKVPPQPVHDVKVNLRGLEGYPTWW
jgi:hypothetical protein